MLSHTFIHISGIGPKTEQQLWQAGVESWQDFRPPASLSRSKVALIEQHMRQQPADALLSPDYFSQRLSSRDCWRLFGQFRQRTAYIDIETTGNSWPATITTVCLYDGEQIFTYVNGDNLAELPHHLAAFDLLVTYNGNSFDLPVLENFFDIQLPQASIDLRPILAALGYKGGLKGCEKQLNIQRHDLEGLDGYAAVLLWQAYRRSGEQRYLDTLLAYNIADTINMEPLMVAAYNLHLRQTPFHRQLSLPEPASPALPIQPCPRTVAEIKARLS